MTVPASRSFARFLEPSRWRKFLGAKCAEWRERPRVERQCWSSWRMRNESRHLYRFLSEVDLARTKKSPWLFIFGCGFSLNEIPEAEWRAMENHDTLGFNWFVKQNFVRCDYYVLREVLSGVSEMESAERRDRRLGEFTECLRKPVFQNTIYLVQKGWKAYVTNYLLGAGLLPHGARVFPFHTRARGKKEPPSGRFQDGLVHGPATLADCVNFGYILGYEKIILVGVDLYDQRYFWLPPDRTRPDLELKNIAHDQAHPGNHWIVDFFRYWKPYYDAKGISIEIYNPRSLLTSVFPIFDRAALRRNGSTVGGRAS